MDVYINKHNNPSQNNTHIKLFYTTFQRDEILYSVLFILCIACFLQTIIKSCCNNANKNYKESRIQKILHKKKYKQDCLCSECSICLETFIDKETVYYLPQCNHNYHKDCITIWLLEKNTCPLCRIDVM